MKIRCQMCGSTNISTSITQKTNYSISKGIVGGLLIPGGSIMGLERKKESLHICQDCGLDSTGTLSASTCAQIDEALRTNDIKMLIRLKRFYKNIEWDESQIPPPSPTPPPRYQESEREKEKEIVYIEKAPVIQKKIVFSGNVNIEACLKRVSMFLEDGEYETADDYCEQILNQNPECADAYLGKLLAGLKLKSLDDLENCLVDYEKEPQYKKLIRFASDELKTRLALTKVNNAKRKELISHYAQRQKLAHSIIVCSVKGIVGLKQDGTVIASGRNDKQQFNIEDWGNIVKIIGQKDITVGIKNDGTLVTAGFEKNIGKNKGPASDVFLYGYASAAIEITKHNSVNLYPFDDWVADLINLDAWNNIVAICQGGNSLLGLRSDGYLMPAGSMTYEEWDDNLNESVTQTFDIDPKQWTEISKIIGTHHFTGNNIFALRKNGTVLAAGSNKTGNCNVEEWCNIIDIAAQYFLVGLKSDGTVVTTCEDVDVSNWSHIVAIICSSSYVFGLKEDGTVVVSGTLNDPVVRKGVDEYKAAMENWRDIIAIVGDEYANRIVGLKKDGTLVLCDVGSTIKCDVQHWKLFENFDTYEEDRNTIFEQRRLKEEALQEEKMRKEEEERRKFEEESDKCTALIAELKAEQDNIIKSETINREIDACQAEHDKLSGLKNNWPQIEEELSRINNRIQSIKDEILRLIVEKENLGWFAGKRRKEIPQTISNLESEAFRLKSEKEAWTEEKQGYHSSAQICNKLKNIEEKILALRNQLDGLPYVRPSGTVREELNQYEIGRKLLERYDDARRIKVGEYFSFGSYKQKAESFDSKERIEWLVLEIKKNRALLISKYALDVKPYNNTRQDVTWETCFIRKWLNNDFINSAFSEEEKEIIQTVTVQADKNPVYSTNPGKSTCDKVFLLSIAEVQKYCKSNKVSCCGFTDYAKKKGPNVISTSANCSWWLRTPGSLQNYASRIDANGSVVEKGNHIDGETYGVRPALWIYLDN